jgi:acylphosphatase
MSDRPAVRILVSGRVQGVGFRYWTVQEARRLGLDGWVRNRSDGTVEILAVGAAKALSQLARSCREGPPAAHVVAVAWGETPDDGSRDFIQRPTSRGVAGVESAEI